MTPVPYLRLGDATAELRPELDAAVARVLDSGRYVLGPEVEAFEHEWAAHCQTGHAVGVASGLDALELALRALGVGPGDDVLVPSNTYIATWLAVTAVGARVVPVEPDDEHLVSVAAYRAAVTPATAAVLCVHLHGRAVDGAPLRAWCDAHGIALVEDAAQAHGARRDGLRAGAMGHAGCWSFYPSKNLGALGDGGAVTTDDPALAERLRTLRNYGAKVRYEHAERGRNSRLDELQAAILRVKLRHLDAWNDRRRAIAARYGERLAGVRLPAPDPGHVWHLYVVRSPERDRLRDALNALGVGTEIHYPVPPHRSAAYADHALGPFPVADRLAGEVLSLPIGPQLPLAAADAVVAAVTTATASAAVAA